MTWRLGDVVVYYDQATGGHVVHRVVAEAEGGLVTRGDNNPACDTRPVAYGQVVGRVSSAEIGGRYKEVAGGQGGLWAARRRWAGRALWVHLAKWLGKPYRWLKRSIWVRRALRALIRPHFEVIRLQTPQGALVKVLHRGKVVGRTAPGGEQLVWCQPYDLWVEASDLPVPAERIKIARRMNSWLSSLKGGLKRGLPEDRMRTEPGSTRANLENLRPFIARHWRKAVLGVVLILGTSLLNLPAPLITRYLIDQVILAGSSGSDPGGGAAAGAGSWRGHAGERPAALYLHPF